MINMMGWALATGRGSAGGDSVAPWKLFGCATDFQSFGSVDHGVEEEGPGKTPNGGREAFPGAGFILAGFTHRYDSTSSRSVSSTTWLSGEHKI